MSSALGDPVQGDIYCQRGIVITNGIRNPNKNLVHLHVSNEHGEVLDPKVPGENLISLPKEAFEKTYLRDNKCPGHFIKKVEIDEVDEGQNMVYVYPIDNKGNKGSRCGINRRKFMKSYFLP